MKEPYSININESADSLGQTSGPGWSFTTDSRGGVFSISQDGEYNIVGNGKVSPNRFVVEPGVKAKIILTNVNIQTSGLSPFDMSGATVDMYLKGDNTIECLGGVHGAGLQTSTKSNLTISSFSGDFSTSGKLTAIGSLHGAGIGGACNGNSVNHENGGTITIKGGTIVAIGGTEAAGIGGGSKGYIEGGGYTKILIEGGNVTANGGIGAAGIGTGANPISSSGSVAIPTSPAANAGEIIITGGTVTAKGGNAGTIKPSTTSYDYAQGAGIGGGSTFNSGKIEISSNASVKSVTTSGYIDPANTFQIQNKTPSIGCGEKGTTSNVTSTNSSPSIAREVPTLPTIDVRKAIKVSQTSTEVTENVTTRESTLVDTSKFYNEDGVFLIRHPQTLKLSQGNGKNASVTLYENDTIFDVAKKINNAIANDLGQGHYADNQDKFCTISDGTENSSESVFKKDFVSEEENTEDIDVSSNPDAISGKMTTNIKGYNLNATMLVRSVIPGKAGEIYFSGDEDLLNALGFNTIQESQETEYTASVYDAHSGAAIATNIKSNSPCFRNFIAPDIDIEVDPMAGLKANWHDAAKEFIISHEETYTAILHLKDNSTIFQIGANEGEDFLVQLGDSSCSSLGISAVNVLTRETASYAISVIDAAINKNSSQRAKIGAYSNALEHTMENLTAASLNLTNAESRIRDADMSKMMMELVKLQILNQSGSSMLAQANQLPNAILSLMK